LQPGRYLILFNILPVFLSIVVIWVISKYTQFFLFNFWWHQLFSLTFFFSCLVLLTLHIQYLRKPYSLKQWEKTSMHNCRELAVKCLMAMTNIVQKKMMQYFPEIQMFVCCLWSGFFFPLQFNFSVKRK
jgi:hypothetical protein